MITQKHHCRRDTSLLFFSCIAFLLILTTCMTVDDSLLSSKLLIINEEGIVFESDGGIRTFKIECNSNWSVKLENGVDWININPTIGSKEVTQFTINVKKNEGSSREASFIITASSIDKAITIIQKGKDGEDDKDVSTNEYITIKDVRSMYEDNGQNEMTFDKPLMLKAVVISDRIGSNRSSKRDGFMQDENGNGLAFRVTQAENMYHLGDELIINLKDAKFHYYDYAGIFQLVFSNKNAEVANQNITIAPKELKIEEIESEIYDGTLVKIKNVQFKDYEGLNYYGGEGNATTRILESANGATINVKTTKNASFRSQPLPAGKGTIVGIVSLCKNNWELQIRNLDDVNEMSDDILTRFEQDELPLDESKISVAELRVKLKDSEIYTEDNYIEGEVILNAFNGNMADNVVYLADETAGISLFFSDKEKVLTYVPIGATVKVQMKGLKAKIENELLQIGYDNTLTTKAVEIIDEELFTPLQPKVVTVDELLAGKYQSQLVRIENVQFREIEARYVDNPFIIDNAGKEIQVYTKEEAHFAGQRVKEGMGSIVAVTSINSMPHLLIRSMDDLEDMRGTRFDTSTSFITISKDKVTFDGKGGEQIITISANVNWVALSDATWLSITPTNGVNDGKVTIAANENGGEERKTSIIITNGEVVETVEVIQKEIEQISNVATDLFFSEYIEGSSYNKYLEIYNGTGEAVDLSDYMVEVYINGQSIAKYKQELDGVLNSGEVLVLENPKATLYNGDTFESNALNFNGNDAVALVKVSTKAYLDIIGCIGEDPGKEWTVPFDFFVSTKDRTLVRKPSVRRGIKKNPKNGFPTLGTEWIVYPMDTSDYLGSHTMN